MKYQFQTLNSPLQWSIGTSLRSSENLLPLVQHRCCPAQIPGDNLSTVSLAALDDLNGDFYHLVQYPVHGGVPIWSLSILQRMLPFDWDAYYPNIQLVRFLLEESPEFEAIPHWMIPKIMIFSLSETSFIHSYPTLRQLSQEEKSAPVLYPSAIT